MNNFKALKWNKFLWGYMGCYIFVIYRSILGVNYLLHWPLDF